MLTKMPCVIWLTGLSGSGKSTIALSLAQALESIGHRVKVLDGDELRQGLCADLGFKEYDRTENIRRIAHVANILTGIGVTTIVAAISPLQRLRDLYRSLIPDLIEVFVDAPLHICEGRDPKGLYKKAREGLLVDFTGVDSAFEPPGCPDLICQTDRETVQESVRKVLVLLCETCGQPVT